MAEKMSSSRKRLTQRQTSKSAPNRSQCVRNAIIRGVDKINVVTYLLSAHLAENGSNSFKTDPNI